MKKIFVTLFMLVMLMSVAAQTFTLDGINYNITTDGGVAVSEGAYTGNITIPSNVLYMDATYTVTSIGDYAFAYCTGLTSITIPSSVTSIGESAFAYCTGLTSITIPSSVTSIGESAFEDCTGLIEYLVDSHNSIYASIDGVLFNRDMDTLIAYPYSKSPKYTIPSSVTSIGDGAFKGCTSLTSISIPSSVTSIGYRAFEVCTGLTSITIPSSVTSIGDYAFNGCFGLTSIDIPSSVTSIGDYAFCWCTGLIEYLVDSHNSIYSSIDGVLFNIDIDTLIAYPNSKSPKYTIPSSVTSIGDGAFEGCIGLTSITIPSGVTSIGDGAFEGCIGLTSITIPSGVTSIGESAFDGCTDLTSITIPSSVSSIGDAAFYECTGLTSITIPSGVTSIGESAFDGCTGLTSITIPSSVTSIGDWAFGYCTGLTSISIPHSVTSIGHSTFGYCIGLTSISIPYSVTSIGDGAFYGCTGLIEYLVDSHNSIYSSIDGVLFKKEMDTLIAYPNSKSPKYTIPSSVTSIGNYAFAGCSRLTSITIPSSVTSIGNYAFYWCSGLSEIHSQIETPLPITSFVFYGVNTSTCKLYVPTDSYILYWQEPVWGDFANIIEEEVTAVNAINTNDISVYAEQCDIVVKGIGIGETIFVYTTSGVLVKAIKATSDVRIPVPSDKVYLVRVGGNTFKVAL